MTETTTISISVTIPKQIEKLINDGHISIIDAMLLVSSANKYGFTVVNTHTDDTQFKRGA